jgi:hypothetical protein
MAQAERVDPPSRLSKALRMVGAVGFTPELPMMLGSALAAASGSGLGAAAGAIGSKLRGEDVDWESLSEAINDNIEAWTYVPKLRGSQEALEGAMPALEAYDNMLKEGGAKIAEVSGSPALGAYGYAMANLADPWDVLPIGGTVAALRGASKLAREAATPEVSSAGMGGRQRGAWSPGTLSGKSVDDALTDDMFAEALKSHLTPEEVASLRKDDITKMRNAFRDAAGLDASDLAAAAMAGRAKRGWYKNSSEALRNVFGEDTPRFVSLLAATSPRVSVEGNMRNALTIWKKWNEAGRPQDAASVNALLEESVQRSKFAKADKSSVLDAWRNNTMAALTGDPGAPLPDDVTAFLSGPKVESFRRNLLGDFDEVTNDAWQATATGQDQKLFAGRAPLAEQLRSGEASGVKGPGYMATSAAAREAAERLTQATGEVWTPAEVQETVWSLTKATWEKASKSSTASIRDTLRGMRHEEINDVPDFSGLLAKDEFGQLLRDSGYGQQVDALAQAYQPPVFPADKPAQVSIVPGLEGFERQLAATFRDRTLPRDIRRARGGSRTASDAGGGLYTRGGEVPGGSVLSGNVIESFSPSDALVRALRRHDLNAPVLHELDPATSAQMFYDAIGKSKANTGAYGAAVQRYSPEEYAQMRLFMPDDAQSGFALKQGEHGPDLVSLFNDPNSAQRSFSYPSLALGMAEGAKTLDAFDTILPKLYSQMGFEEAARLPFSRKRAPEGWDYNTMRRFNQGEPDVVFMGLRPWDFNSRGRATPPEHVVSPVGPREYNPNLESRNDLLAASYAGALRRQGRLVTPNKRQGELLGIAAENEGRLPPDLWTRVRAGRRSRRQK